jgi:phage terminase large subunit-like protein
MGLRGAHARPMKRGKRTAKPAGRHSEPWCNAGLSRADRVIVFLETLPITKGIKTGHKMQLLPGQKQFVRAIYDNLAQDGRRIVKLAIKSEPRGNGKTGLLSGLALAHLLGPECEPRGEIYSAAYNKLQAGLIFKEMKAIVETVPEFSERVNVQRYGMVLEVMEGQGAGSTFESLSADDKRAHGLSPTLWIYDEFAQAPNTELLDNLKTAAAKRSDSLGIVISTQAGNDQHPLSQMIDDAALGLDPGIYLQLACAPDDADIFDARTWHACNEALGEFLDIEAFRNLAEQAKRLPGFRAKFENLNLNRRIDASAEFISDPDWMECAAPVDRRALAGRPCYAGLDLSTTTDMSALCLYWPDSGAVIPYFWLPADGLLERDKKESLHYRTWRDDGLLETTPGKAINFAAIIKRLAEISVEFNLQVVAYDRAYINTFKRMCEEGGATLPLKEFGQGYVSMAPAVQALEAAILDKRIRHGGHPILRWQVSNASVLMDPAGNRKITKKRSRGHVDGLIALLMAIGAHGLQPEPPPPTPRLIFV